MNQNVYGAGTRFTGIFVKEDFPVAKNDVQTYSVPMAESVVRPPEIDAKLKSNINAFHDIPKEVVVESKKENIDWNDFVPLTSRGEIKEEAVMRALGKDGKSALDLAHILSPNTAKNDYAPVKIRVQSALYGLLSKGKVVKIDGRPPIWKLRNVSALPNFGYTNVVKEEKQIILDQDLLKYMELCENLYIPVTDKRLFYTLREIHDYSVDKFLVNLTNLAIVYKCYTALNSQDVSLEDFYDTCSMMLREELVRIDEKVIRIIIRSHSDFFRKIITD